MSGSTKSRTLETLQATEVETVSRKLGKEAVHGENNFPRSVKPYEVAGADSHAYSDWLMKASKVELAQTTVT